jgi:hypothetical protein
MSNTGVLENTENVTATEANKNPKRTWSRKKKAPEAGTTLTWEQVQELLEKQATQNRENMLEMVKELRKPDPEEQAKREQERENRIRSAREQAQMAAEEEAQRKATQAACSHTKENGRSCIMGQVHSDGCYHGICFRCGYAAPPQKMDLNMNVGGIGDTRGFEAA